MNLTYFKIDCHHNVLYDRPFVLSIFAHFAQFYYACLYTFHALFVDNYAAIELLPYHDEYTHCFYCCY